MVRGRRKRRRQSECWLGRVPKPAAKSTEKINEERKKKGGGLTGKGLLIVLPHGNKVP